MKPSDACDASRNRFEGLVSVSSVRSQNPLGFGGCIFSGFEVDLEGRRSNSGRLYVIIAKGSLLPGDVSKGERWRISGRITRRDRKELSGYRIIEVTIEADTPLVKERETGDLIIGLVAKNPRFKRLGEVRMRRLWNKHGEAIYKILDDGDLKALCEDLSSEDATGFIEAWRDHVSGATVSFLSAHGIPNWLSRKIIDFYGTNVKAELEDDPYRLLSFTASWPSVDALAREHFHISDDDPRRLRAAIEESLYRLVDKKGHTCVPSVVVKEQLKRLLGGSGGRDETNRLIDKALADNASNGAYVVTDDNHYWPTGAFIMEDYVAEKIAGLVLTPDPLSPSLFLSSFAIDHIDRLIDEFEQQEHVRLKREFILNEAQRMAVHNCVNNRFSLITGGAGTGKTTVLRCLYYVLTKSHYSICQMALSGRAAKRMQTATGFKATTIAGYLRKSKDIQSNLGEFGYYVIDEASMLDISTTYQILRSISEDRSIRIVMVGDPCQLPPIMAGLVLHILAEDARIPAVHLAVCKRQEEMSGIPAVASSVRHGVVPALISDSGGVRFISCSENEILGKTLEIFSVSPNDTQILCATKNCSWSGTKAINAVCREHFSKGQHELLVRSDAIKGAFGYCGLRLTDRAMFTKNDYGRGINNGSIGCIIEIYDVPKGVDGYAEPAIAKGEFDGIEVEIFESHVAGKHPILELGYAVTVHKAQGSQWPRVIVPIRQSRNLDRTLLYTAVTRAESEVILVGDMTVLRKAIERMPIPRTRAVGLGKLLHRKLATLGG